MPYTVRHVVYVMITERPSCYLFFFLMIRRPPRSTLDRSSAASDVYKRQAHKDFVEEIILVDIKSDLAVGKALDTWQQAPVDLSLIHISEPTRPY